MYRLFYELTHVPYSNPAIVDILPEIESLLNTLSYSELNTVIARLQSNQQHLAPISNFDEQMIQAGIYCIADAPDEEYEKLLEQSTKNNIIIGLEEHGIEGFAPSWTKGRLIHWIMTQHREFLHQKFMDYGTVFPSQAAANWLIGVQKAKHSVHYGINDWMLYTPYKADNTSNDSKWNSDSSQPFGSDPLLSDAIDVIIDTGSASTSMLQRRLKIGYAHAARIIDELEVSGVIGPFDGSNARQVLLTKEQWNKLSDQS